MKETVSGCCEHSVHAVCYSLYACPLFFWPISISLE